MKKMSVIALVQTIVGMTILSLLFGPPPCDYKLILLTIGIYFLFFEQLWCQNKFLDIIYL